MKARLEKRTPAAPSLSLRPIGINPTKDENALNKTEAAFLAKLRAEKWDWIGIQSITLKLGDDCRYTPDFVTLRDGSLVVWEVKGFFRDDAKVKIKAAARSFPFFNFIVVTRKSRTRPFVEHHIQG